MQRFRIRATVGVFGVCTNIPDDTGPWVHHDSIELGLSLARAFRFASSSRPVCMRDIDNECTEFVDGIPSQNGSCYGDGHYLCTECEKHTYCVGCVSYDGVYCGNWEDAEAGGCLNYDGDDK